MISALLVTERSITPLERGAPFLWSEFWPTLQRVPLPESQARIPVCPTVASSNRLAVDLHQRTPFHSD